MDSLNTRIDNLDGSIYNVVGNLSGTVENLQKNLNGLQNQITNLSQQFRNHRHGPGRRRIFVYINKKEDETYVDSPNYKHTGHKAIVSEQALSSEFVREGFGRVTSESGMAEVIRTKSNVKLEINPTLSADTNGGIAYSLKMAARIDNSSAGAGEWAGEWDLDWSTEYITIHDDGNRINQSFQVSSADSIDSGDFYIWNFDLENPTPYSNFS